MLRPYQTKAVQEIRSAYAKGVQRILLKMPTGSGKTVVFSHILNGLLSKNNPGMMLVRGRQLVDQASQRLLREKTDHGVLMAGHWNHDPRKLIQICSADTIRSRELRPKATLIVVDEAHMAVSPTFRKIMADYPDALVLAVTATPYVEQPMDHLAEIVICPITVRELVDQGYLVPLRYFAPRTPDLSNIKMKGKDFDDESLSRFMQDSVLVGDVVTEWKKNAQSRPTIVFAVDVAHSKAIEEAFNLAQIPACHLDANSSLELRQEKIDLLRTGKLSVLTNCGVLSTGVDMPHVSCIVLARPTKSYNLHIQQLGRGTRICEGKSDCLVLDHAGNVTRHGFIDEEREATLNGKPKDEKLPAPITCEVCYGVFRFEDVQARGICPLCSAKFRVEEMARVRTLMRIDGELVEIKELTPRQQAERDVKLWKKERKAKGHKRGWIYYKLKAKWGEEMTELIMPKRVVPSWVKRE